MKKIFEAIAATAEAMGNAISPSTAAMMAADLSAYPDQVVIKALTIVRRQSKFKLTLADVLEQIEALSPDGRPTMDRAWAMMPKDDSTSAVITQEMASAWGCAYELFQRGDEVGAQIAFKREYAALVSLARTVGEPPAWFPCLGHDKASRAPALALAVAAGSISVDHALRLVADTANDQKMIVDACAGAKLISPDQARQLLPPPGKDMTFAVAGLMIGNDGQPTKRDDALERVKDLRRLLNGD